MTKPILKTFKHRYKTKVFLLGLLTAFLFFMPFIIYDKGYFIYFGDFNSQQIPFYKMVHDSVRQGNILWNNLTDLGVNLIGSYTFYLITSPFFWLTLPFPSAAVPYLMGPLLILKFAFAALTAYIFLKRYVKNKDLAVLGGLLYSFSGFCVYAVFFNHFHEPVIVFPLLLAALDEYMYNKRRGLFAMAVFAACFINYYFFVGQVIFIIIYWIIRMIFDKWTLTIKEFLWLAFEAVLGVALSSIALLPSILAVLQNNRITKMLTGWNMLIYDKPQKYIHILECFFFPPDIPAQPNFAPDSGAKWASVAAWMPLVSMTGVIAWFQTNKKHWTKPLLIALYIIAIIPILNSIFQFFNSEYYARWYYMLILIMALVTIMTLQKKDVDWKKAIITNLTITLAIALPIGLLPGKTDDGEVQKTTIGLMKYPDRFWAYVGISMISIVLFILLIIIKDDNRRFIKYTVLSTCVITIVYSCTVIGIGKSVTLSSRDYIIPICIEGKDKIKLPNAQPCRTDLINGIENQVMYWEMPCLRAFHSIVPGSVMEFYPTLGVHRGTASKPGLEQYGLRGLTSCKWAFDREQMKNNFTLDMGETKMPGWSYYDTQNGIRIWQNDYFIPYGFTYDKYITKTQYEYLGQDYRHLVLLKAIVLDEKQAARHADILENISDVRQQEYTQYAYFDDCNSRNKLTCSSFDWDNRGFTAKITTSDKKDELVFFSIPYEDGWSATLNGKRALIERVNIGFMAVRVPKGQTSTIRFNYMTPGLRLGAIISGASLVILCIYIVFSIKSGKFSRPKRKIYRIKVKNSENDGV